MDSADELLELPSLQEAEAMALNEILFVDKSEYTKSSFEHEHRSTIVIDTINNDNNEPFFLYLFLLYISQSFSLLSAREEKRMRIDV
ncbi:hypothetical protein prwr041_17380 [Prevotella herbatica]|uniref:Uncharacterized protein n=1 Tax=Prevotella herbatica TaxID=2801997 RepID=A0ABN6EIU5_9BACT|nr:hypothetical protein prwr041_17380 [Prevotella herbatica]